MKGSIIIFIIGLIHNILCEDYLQKLKETIKEGSKELFKEMNEEIKKLQKAEDFSIIQVLEESIIKSLKNNEFYEKEKELFKKIEDEFETFKKNPSVTKAEEFIVNAIKEVEKKIPSTNDLMKGLKQLQTVIKSLTSLVIPKSLSLPTANAPAPYPTKGEVAPTQTNWYPRPPAPAPVDDGRKWGQNESKWCNADNCSGCCLKGQCFPLEECKYYFISHTIITIIVICFVCCGCFGLAIGAIFFYNKKRRDLEEKAEMARSLKRNEINTTNGDQPVQGIPVQQTDRSVQGGVVVGARTDKFNVLAEENTEKAREVQMEDFA